MSITNDSQRHFGRIEAEEVDAERLVLEGVPLTTAWSTYTPTYSTGAPNAASTIAGRFKVIGSTCVLKFTLRQSAAGTAGSGNYLVSLPPGIRAVVGSVSEAVGSATLQVGATSHIGAVMMQPGATSFGIFVSNDTVAPAFWSSSLGALSGTDLTVTASITFEVL